MDQPCWKENGAANKLGAYAMTCNDVIDGSRPAARPANQKHRRIGNPIELNADKVDEGSALHAMVKLTTDVGQNWMPYPSTSKVRCTAALWKTNCYLYI